MGNPDLDAPKHVKDKLVETLSKTRIDRYSALEGHSGTEAGAGGLLTSAASE